MRRFAAMCPYFRDLHITNGLEVHHGVSRGARQHKDAASMTVVDPSIYVAALAYKLTLPDYHMVVQMLTSHNTMLLQIIRGKDNISLFL
jgi:hypothetical protein